MSTDRRQEGVATPRGMDRARLGQQLRGLRRAKGLTQRDLPQPVGVTFQYISDIEKGKANPTLEVLERFAAAVDGDLQIDVDPATKGEVAEVMALVRQLSPAELAYVARAAAAIRKMGDDDREAYIGIMERKAGIGAPNTAAPATSVAPERKARHRGASA